MRTEILKLRSRHFTNATFHSTSDCPLARCAKEHFNVRYSIEAVVYTYVDGNNGSRKFGHKGYGLMSYWIDSIKAKLTSKNTILREIKLTEI